MRLHGWQRIGIVASILWLVAGGLWINSLVIDDLGKFVVAAYSRCPESRSIQPDGSIPADTDWGPCNRKFNADWPVALKNHWTITAAYTLIPIPLAWLIIYGLVALVRWIKAGFVGSH
jgi:hypothetical protein